MATIGEMIVKLLADTGSFNASMDEAAAKVTASSDAMAASMASSMQSFRDFDNITKQSVQSTEGLAEAQAALQAVQQTGAYTAEELAAKQALVDGAMSKVGRETEKASGVLSMFTRNSRTMYSTSALITDAMTGQFSRMRREVAALANETGLMARAFRMLMGPVGLAAIAVGGFAVAEIDGELNAEKLSGALEATGGAIGVTIGQITQMRDGMIDSETTTGEATEALRKLALSGEFLGSNLGDAARAAQNMAELTGESMDQAVTAVEKLGKDPVKALQALNSEFHFLTVPEAQEIAHLIEIGDKAGAAAAAIRDLANAEAHRNQVAQDTAGDTANVLTESLAARWKADKDFFNNLWNAGGPTTLQQHLEDVQSEIEKTADMYHAQLTFKSGKGEVVANNGLMDRSAQDLMNSLLARRKELMDQIAAASKKAADTAAQTAKTTKDTNDIIAGAGKGSKGSGMSGLEQQFKEQEAAAHASYDQMKVDAADFWNAQATDSKNSAAVQADAWQKYIDARHQLDEQGLRNESEADRKREQSALKAAEADKRAAEERARAEERASQEIQQEIQKENALHLQNAEGEMQIAKKQIDIDRQALQDKYDAHQINAQQLLQGQLRLDDELLAAELAYLNKKKELDAGDVAAVARDQQQITLAVLEAEQRRLQDEDRALKQSEQHWKQYSQRIAGAFQNSINSMLFQGQKLKNGLASVAESILETFLENVVEQPLQAFIASEGQKLAAAIGFGAQKTATENAQRATNAAADVADKTAASARAAGLAGAQGVASFAAAPWPVDIGAPAFGAAMMASALSFGAMASAAGGWERVPADGMLTELHRDEMVLPKHVADPMRNMARNGGGGGGNTYHIHAADAASFKDFLRRNPGVLAGGARYAYARGHF